MKKRLLLFTILFSSISFAQIKTVEASNSELIGKVLNFGNVLIQCEKIEDKYTFAYQDAKFVQVIDYKSFSFEDTDNAFDNLYNEIMKGFINPPKDNILVELPKGFIWLSYTKAMGVVNFRFAHSETKGGEVVGFSSWLTKKRVMKLFGKKKSKRKV